MLNPDVILAAIPHALEKLEVAGDLPRGKVRDFYVTPDGKRRVLINTDRLSIFDHPVGVVPFKGQVLNQLSAWWFARTADIIPNHVLQNPDPNVTVVREANPIQLAVVVRGYVTGVTPTSLWTYYQAGQREMYDIKLPDGLKKNDPLPVPVVTPTTKATLGHDNRQSIRSVVGEDYLPADAWELVQSAALRLYKRGQDVALRGGLILVDSKYEFGFDADSGRLMLIDELHTPESSRFWKADTYSNLVAAGREPQNLDKELARLWYVAHGYSTGAVLPPLPKDVIVSLSQSFQQVYELITEEVFQPADYPAQNRIEKVLEKIDAEPRGRH